MGLNDILKLVKLTHDFQNVERTILVKGTERHENDIEHSFQLALLAWYIVDAEKLELDKDLVIKYAMVHDLVEIFAGDTWAFSADGQATKQEREHAAQEQLKKELPNFDELHDLIQRYEGRVDEESRFVYALDKIVPMLNIYLDGGRSWREDGVTIEMLRTHKAHKVAVSPDVAAYFEQIMAVLQREESQLFKKDN